MKSTTNTMKIHKWKKKMRVKLIHRAVQLLCKVHNFRFDVCANTKLASYFDGPTLIVNRSVRKVASKQTNSGERIKPVPLDWSLCWWINTKLMCTCVMCVVYVCAYIRKREWHACVNIVACCNVLESGRCDMITLKFDFIIELIATLIRLADVWNAWFYETEKWLRPIKMCYFSKALLKFQKLKIKLAEHICDALAIV